MSTETPSTKLSIENNTPVRTNLAVPATLARGNYVPVDRSIMLEAKLSFRAKALYMLLLSLSDHDLPTVGWLAKQTQQGKSVVVRLLAELEQGGWIKRRPIKHLGARRDVIDLMGAPNWYLSKNDGSVPFRTDPSDHSEVTPIDQSQPGPIRFHSEPTRAEVGSIQNRPERSNPCATTVTDPLIKADINIIKPKERKEENPTPLLSLVGGSSDLVEKKINWVPVAKQVQDSFDADFDFRYQVLNPFVKTEAAKGRLHTLRLFADWLIEVREDTRRGSTFPATKRNLRLLWDDFLYRQGEKTVGLG